MQSHSRLWKNSHPECEKVRPYPVKCWLLMPELSTAVIKLTSWMWNRQTQFSKCRLFNTEPFTLVNKFTLVVWKSQTLSTKMHTSNLRAIHTRENHHTPMREESEIARCRLLTQSICVRTYEKRLTPLVWKR